jgi:two-component system KDP operon response regulator KdpE
MLEIETRNSCAFSVRSELYYSSGIGNYLIVYLYVINGHPKKHHQARILFACAVWTFQNMNIKKNIILVIDTDLQTQKMLSRILDTPNFKVVGCETGAQGLQFCVSSKPDLVLLALNLPDMEGKQIITDIREWSKTPIIVLSENAADENVITALNMGADDYVVKPFNVDVLYARINASLRKSAIQETGEPELYNGPLRMDLVRHEVFLNGKLLAFTPKEYNLLRYFIVHRGKMLTHKQILNHVWGPAHGGDTQYLRVFISQVREKIEENPAAPKLIITEAGIGYRMDIADGPEAVNA